MIVVQKRSFVSFQSFKTYCTAATASHFGLITRFEYYFTVACTGGAVVRKKRAISDVSLEFQRFENKIPVDQIFIEKLITSTDS
jgi:hypothetical protein